MLELLRRGTKSWTAKILFALLIASFAIWGIGDVFRIQQDTTVARVGERTVEADLFANAMSRQQAQLSREQKQVVSFELLRNVGFDRRVLASLVRDAALAEELQRLGIAIPDEAVAAEVTKTPAFHDAGGAFSPDLYRSVLQQQDFTPTEFEALNRSLIGQRLLQGVVAGSARVPPGAATRIAAREGETRAVDVLRLTPALAPDPGTPDDAALETFYKANPALFTRPERRSGRALLVDVAALVAGAIPDEAAARAVYDGHPEQYSVAPTRVIDQLSFPDLAAAQAAADRVRAGTDFAALAGELGQAGTMSLGKVAPTDLPEAVAAAVFAATAPGVVGPVATTVGAVLIRVTEVTEGFVTPFEIVGPVIRESMARDAARQKAPEIATQVEELRAAGKSLEEIAAATGLEVARMDGLARDGSLADGSAATGPGARDELRAELFAALQGEERDMVRLADGGYLLVMVDEITPSSLPPLAEVRAGVIDAWGAQTRLDALTKMGQEIAAKVAGTDASLAEVATGLGRSVTRIDAFAASATPEALPAGLVPGVFQAKLGDAVSGAAVATATEPAGVLVVEIAEITPMAADELAKTSGRLEQALARSLAEDQAEYFGRAVETAIGVELNPAAIDGVFRRLGVGVQAGG